MAHHPSVEAEAEVEAGRVGLGQVGSGWVGSGRVGLGWVGRGLGREGAR